MKQFYEQIVTTCKRLLPEVQAVRRDLHRHPQQGWLEYYASAKVAERLSALGYEVQTDEAVTAEPRIGQPSAEAQQQAVARALEAGANPMWVKKMQGGKTGVIGLLHCGEGPTVALRFDLDALPIVESKEPTRLPVREGFVSEWEDSMHACGHDGHTAIGLGVAEVLMAQKDRLHGTLKLIFQPAEEGVRGAVSVVRKGHLDDVDILLGAHIQNRGDFGGQLLPNACGALATTKLNVTLHGKAAHAGSAPEKGNNVMLGLAAAISGLYSIPRHSEGASRINVGKVAAGTGRNVIADTATMEIEVRGATTAINTYMEAYARRVIEGACAMHGLTNDIEVCGTALSLHSDEALVAKISTLVETYLPAGTLSPTPRQVLVDSEDFSYMMARVQAHGGKAAFMRLLTTVEDVPHGRAFDFDESVLLTGLEAFSLTAAAALTGQLAFDDEV